MARALDYMQLQPTHNKVLITVVHDCVQIVNKEDLGRVMWLIAYFERSLVRVQPLLLFGSCVRKW